MVAHPAPEPLYMLRRKPHTSASAVREYVQCPRKYFFHYVESVPPSFKAAAAAFGSTWHATIGLWLTREDVERDELEAFFREDLAARLAEERTPVLFDDEGEDEGRLVDVGLKMLRAFLARVKRPSVVHGVEVPFAIGLTHPSTGEVLAVPLIGALDALVVYDGVKHAIELKTARRRWNDDQLAYDLQLSLYRIAAGELGHGDARLRLLVATKAAHPELQAEDVVRHRADVDEAIDVVFGVHAAVAAGVDHRNRGWWCQSCPYAAPCRP